MRRLLPLLSVLVVVPAAPATATPTFALDHEAASSLTSLPVRTVSRLTMGAGGQEERFRLRSQAPLTFSGDVRAGQASVVSPGVGACPGRWQRFHFARLELSTFTYDVTIPAGGTGVATGTDVLNNAPWPGEDELGLAFEAQPEFTGAPSTLTGDPLTVAAQGPRYLGPLGVQLRLATGGGRIFGTTTPVVDIGRVVLRALPAGSSRSIPVARLRLRDGAFSVRWKAPRPGRYEIYAQYRTTSPSNYANDASECGLRVVAR